MFFPRPQYELKPINVYQNYRIPSFCLRGRKRIEVAILALQDSGILLGQFQEGTGKCNWCLGHLQVCIPWLPHWLAISKAGGDVLTSSGYPELPYQSTNGYLFIFSCISIRFQLCDDRDNISVVYQYLSLVPSTEPDRWQDLKYLLNQSSTK